MRRALPIIIMISLLVAGCIPSPSRRGGPRYHTPPDSPERLRACLTTLRAEGMKFELLPDRRFPGGCSATASVKLVAIGIPVTNLGAIKCISALPFSRWVHDDVPQAAQRFLGSSVTKIESYGTFACRPVNNQSGNVLSEHGKANAIDIAAFQLADGRRITVKAGWHGPDPATRNFLRALHRAACGRFSVVLGPAANAYHQDHFHFDMGNGPYCR